MAKKNYTTEQIIIKLREIEVLCGIRYNIFRTIEKGAPKE